MSKQAGDKGTNVDVTELYRRAQALNDSTRHEPRAQKTSSTKISDLLAYRRKLDCLCASRFRPS
jgi:hypothetical protein